MVKFPDPVQPIPFKDHVPEIVFPLAVPDSVSVLPAGLPDCTTNWNFPVTLPLKSPISVNAPVSVSPDTKHGESVVKLKLLTLSEPSPFTTNDVPKVKMEVPFASVRVAFQIPLILP